MKYRVDRSEQEVSKMFNSIAPNYDKLNTILSLGIDNYWRRVLLNKIKEERSAKVLDLACGTGDITTSLMEMGVEAVGLDIAEKMVEVAQKKSRERHTKLTKRGKRELMLPIYKVGSAESLPFEKESFDAVTIAFGARNFENLEEALLEVWRVLKGGGTLSILEFATPKNKIWNTLYSLYFNQLLPIIGKVVTGHPTAYLYLPNSVKEFPQYEELLDKLREANFTELSYRALTGGVALHYSAKKETSK